jgi:hypothetical protein
VFFSEQPASTAGPDRLDCVEEKMNARILGKVLGATAVLALLVPVAVSPAAAQTWYGGPPDYGYGQGSPGRGSPYQYGGEQGYGPGETYGPDRTYGADEGYGPSRPYSPDQTQTYGANPGYGPNESYGPDQTYGADEGYGPSRPYGPDQTQTYGAGQGYGPNESYDGGYGPNGRSAYRPPEVPPARQGYGGQSVAPQGYGAGYPESYYPRSFWGYPQAQTGGRASDRAERLVSAIDVNMRAAPSNDAPVRTVLPAGTPVRIIGSTASGWVQVESPFGQGWVYSRYLAPA